MKNYIKNKLTILFTGLLLLPACELSEVNVNPNSPAEAPFSAILSGAEGVLAYNFGMDAGILSTTVMQQTTGANGDATANDNYTANANRFNNLWSGFYGNVMQELDIIIRNGEENNSPYYVGISRVLTALALGTLTDVFGDIPYSEALKGRENTLPAYDSQQEIYATIQELLDAALVDLNQSTDAFTTAPPATDDLIFNGDIEKWKALAWTMKARYALHLSKLNPTEAATQALSYLYNGGVNGTYRGITSNDGDATIYFGEAQTNANPFYQQNTSRPGWVGLGASFINLLNGNQVTDPNTQPATNLVDPRRSYFATQFPANSGNYQGGTAGISGAYSVIGTYYGSPASPVEMVTFVEAKFIEAEARLILNPADPEIQNVLEQAVSASFDKIVTTATDPSTSPENKEMYLAEKAVLIGDYQVDLNTIITQKYVALFLHPEVWVDYRRTGFPAIPLAVNGDHSLNPGGQIPRRFPYPLSEQTLNTENMPNNGASNYQTPRLWWDQK